jgi:hypothetical protein
MLCLVLLQQAEELGLLSASDVNKLVGVGACSGSVSHNM